MPKERIDARPGYEFDGSDGHGRSVVEVSWGRETDYVQVVSKVIDRFTGDPYVKNPDEVLSPRAARTVDEMEAPVPRFTDGMYVDLDRRGINDLIRVLRRARDQAFGRDE